MYEYCEEHSIPHERCGKLIVARNQAELGRLDELERRGRENGVPGLRRLSAGELREVEPHAVGVAALHSPHTGIVDFGAVARVARRRTRAGGDLGRGRVDRAANGPDRDRATRAARPRARFAVFCAGAASDRLAVAAGARPTRASSRSAAPTCTCAARARSSCGADLPGARPLAAVPRRPPHAPHRRPRVARAERAAVAARAARPDLARHLAHGAALVAHRSRRSCATP